MTYSTLAKIRPEMAKNYVPCIMLRTPKQYMIDDQHVIEKHDDRTSSFCLILESVRVQFSKFTFDLHDF